jgi:tRNA-2-methylthio-N6-dimethylallyladenosine synthase
MENKLNTKRKVFVRTFGCQMNARDSEIIAGLLKAEGYRLTDSPKGADILLFNTCSVRQHAEDKVWSEIGTYKYRDGHSKKRIIGLVGCMAQNYKEKVFSRAGNVDFVVGPNDIDKIPSIIKKLSDKKFFEAKIWETGGITRPGHMYHTGFYEDKTHASVVISEGCSNFCSYCVVPYVRGALRHRDHKDILKEIEEAVGQGLTAITLLGQNVNAYRHGDVDFVRLLELVNKIEGLESFNFITSHPKDTSEALFKVMAGSDRLQKYLHLPVQSGADRILALMNRGYTRKFYLELADKYRRIVPGAVLTTDIIVGFPAETEEDFHQTYTLVKGAEFDAAFIFKYSPRPGTEAAKMADDVPRKEKERRHKLILDLQKDISKKKKCVKK